MPWLLQVLAALLARLGRTSKAVRHDEPEVTLRQRLRSLQLASVLLQRPWVSLPADVMENMAQHLDRATLGSLRLVCRSWRSGVDVVLDHLELTRFPDTIAALEKFPVIKSLDVVKPGSIPCSPGAATPPFPPTPHHPHSGPSGQPINGHSGTSDSNGNSSTLHLRQQPQPESPKPSRPSKIAVRRGQLQVQVPDPGLDKHVCGSQHGPQHSPHSRQLNALLKALQQRQVRVKHLALFYERSADSLAHLPSGLLSLTVVNLETSSTASGSGAAAAQGHMHQAPVAPIPAPPLANGAAAPPPAGEGAPLAGPIGGDPAGFAPEGAGVGAAVLAGAGAEGGTVAQSQVMQLVVPEVAWPVLQQLRSLKLVNGLFSMSALASCSQLTRLVLQGEAPSKAKGAGGKRAKPRTLALGPDVGQLVTLQELEVRWVRLGEVAPQLSALSNLTSLNLSDCGLRALPEDIGQLQQLQRLSASGNPDLALPDSLSQLQQLCFLNLSWTRCDIEHLFHLAAGLKALEELRLTGNNIQQLPPSISNLKELKALSLSVNQLEELRPDAMKHLTSLVSLDVSLNHIVHVDRLPPALVKLNLQTNGLKNLPKDLGKQLGKTLQWLDLSNNCLVALPNSTTQLHQLQTLRLSFNQLQGLDRKLARLSSLRLLEAYYAGTPSVQSKAELLQQAKKGLVVAS